VTPGTIQRPQPRFLPSTVHPQPTVNTQVTNNPTQATYQDPTVATTYHYTHAYEQENRQNQQMANASAQMDPRLRPSSVVEMPRPPMYYQQTPAPRQSGVDGFAVA
jgi:hypothetical protein